MNFFGLRATALTVFAIALAIGASQLAAETVRLDDFDVTYNGSSYDSTADTTSFSYSVSGTRVGNDLSHFTLGLPSCFENSDLVSAAPSNAIEMGRDPTTDVTGIKWDTGLSVNSSRNYSIVLDGRWGEASVDVAVKAGRVPEVGTITGPSCGGGSTSGSTYAISGMVWLDADADQSVDSTESPISSVTVTLLDEDGDVVDTVLTGADGTYEFEDLAEGDYTVVVRGTTAASDLNETLSTWFDSTTGASISVSLSGSDSIDNNFGFNVDVSEIEDDLDTADPDSDSFSISGDGKTIGFWKHQCTVAIRSRGRAQVDATTLQGYIDEIETLYLDDPFSFDDANEFQAAFDVMASRSSDMVDLLKKQLLGTEFNTVAGRGLTGHMQLQRLLVAWGESLVADASSFTRAELEDAKDIFDAINNTGS